MSFFHEFFSGGMPGGHSFHGMGGDDSDEEPVDTEKFYKLLGVPKSATQDEIKKAYRKKAKSLHPDRHPNEHEKYQALFQEVQAAHEVLKDPQKRALYDKYGEKGAKQGGGARTGSSLFEQMFGGGGPSQRDHGPKKSPTIKTALDVTLQDIYCGSTKIIKVQRRVAGKDSKTCPRCHGQGQITQTQRMGPMVLQQRRECPSCGGIGYKLEREEHEIEIHVPVGGKHGENVTINGEGHQYPDMAPGDVIFQLRIDKHPIFKRQGADLGMNYTLSLRQALCGYKIKIQHVSGKTLVVTPDDNTEIVQPGSLKVVHTLGLPQRYSPHVKGHLYIVMDVKMPKPQQLSMKVIKQFEELLPEQDNISDIDIDSDDEEKEEKQQQSQSQQNNNTKKKQQQQQQQKQSQPAKKKQPKNKQFKNKKNNNKKKNGKKNNKKNNKKGGMFSGLHGHFGGGGGNKNKGGTNNTNNTDKMDEDDDDDMIEYVECHSVDGNPKATPASASNYYDRDDDDDGDGVQCRQM